MQLGLMASSRRPRAALRSHLLILLAFAALFFWLFSRFFLHGLYLADSDLYEYYLPVFLSPIRVWSSFEFSGLPAFADPSDFFFYPPNLLLGEALGSWTALAMSAYLLAAGFTYAYVLSLTQSRTAATFSAVAYSLSEAMLERLAHFGSVHAIAWLPLILLALDRVRQPEARVWIGIGSVAVASCVLAGHPQPALYALACSGAYALSGLLMERSGWRPYANTLALFALGLALAAVKELPFAEAMGLIARQEIGFERFVGRVLDGPQVLSIVFPTVIHGDSRELPTYVGVTTLLLAVVALARVRANWRVAFWGAASVLAFLTALGTMTPLPDVMYQLPFYNRLRNLSRHLFLFAFGATVLAGYALAFLQQQTLTRKAVARAAMLLGGVMTLGAVLVALVLSLIHI